MSRIVRSLALLATVLVLGAWAPIDSSRPVWSGTVPFSMTDPGSTDLGADTTEAQVQDGMLDWTRVSCTSLTASYEGRTSVRPDPFDGRSVIGWVESGWGYDSSAIGVTQPQFSGGRIREADMEMNGVNFTWVTTPGRGGNVNTYSIVLHEGGHYYGLDHSSEPSAAMYFAYSGGVDALGTDDQNGICALYPGSGSDCTTTGCPSGQTCTGGECVAVMGDGNVCSPCTSSEDCTAGYCLEYPDGGFCGANCSGAGDCGAGEMCITVSSRIPAQCIRVSGGAPSCAGVTPMGCTGDGDCEPDEMCVLSSGACVSRPPTGTGPLGSPCTEGSMCMSGVCFNELCSETCEALNPDSCPAGFYCNGQAVASCGDGLCLPGSAGGAALGATCTNNTDCQSIFCASGRCSEPCIPGGAAVCPADYACQTTAIAGCGACQPERAQLGDPCEINEDCASGLCATDGTNSFCTALCAPEDPGSCGPGFECRMEGPVAVCVPGAGGLGAMCATNDECLSGICATEGGTSYCTRLCDASETCPPRFSCVEASGETRVCRPATVGGGCGCSAAGTGRGPAILSVLGLLALALTLVKRRR